MAQAETHHFTLRNHSLDGISDAAFFRALVEAGGITAAAASLDSSPPSVSRRLAALERRLGVRLADRSAKRFGLTSEGELYYARSAELLAILRDTEAEVSARGAVARGRLRLGAPMDLGRRHVAPLLARFTRDHPGLEAHLILSDSGLELGQDGLDIALRIGPPLEAGVISRKLVDCPTLICASPAYVARQGLPDSLDDLANHECLRLARKHRLVDVWRFRTDNGLREIAVGGQLASESGDVLRSMGDRWLWSLPRGALGRGAGPEGEAARAMFRRDPLRTGRPSLGLPARTSDATTYPPARRFPGRRVPDARGRDHKDALNVAADSEPEQLVTYTGPARQRADQVARDTEGLLP